MSFLSSEFAPSPALLSADAIGLPARGHEARSSAAKQVQHSAANQPTQCAQLWKECPDAEQKPLLCDISCTEPALD